MVESRNNYNFLQSIYEEAIEQEAFEFIDWFPLYKANVTKFKDHAIKKDWPEEVLHDLIKKTKGNGISDLKQKNFEIEEYKKIRDNWDKITETISAVANSNTIDEKTYNEIYTFLRSYTKENRPAASNRVIAAFLPGFVTTVVTQVYLNSVIDNLRKHCPDYPEITNDWLQDNINFIQYCNSKIDFKDRWHSSIFAWYLKVYFESRNNLKASSDKTLNGFVALLESNKNLILTGAPGTGKTYLAKQIAIWMLFKKDDEFLLNNVEKQILDTHYSFVQFHPSYDYTDFVEGFRAEDLNGDVIFNLRNGIFKEFCKTAIPQERIDNFDQVYEAFINDISENEVVFETPVHKKKFKVEINGNKSCVVIPFTNIGTRMPMTKNLIKAYVLDDKILDWKPYLTGVGEYIKSKYEVKITKETNDKYPYIFVIDEINRGELSKVFGELFYAIDPGYRGKKGKVKTQFSNLHKDNTIFDSELGQGWFYVPDNVYIIGTMNDIDRSVESMDFAMRRRFAWKEIKADDRTSRWSTTIREWQSEAMERMISLNKEIDAIHGLGSLYHIGPAYFLKLTNYNGDFELLWTNHLEGVLTEYLRGLPNPGTALSQLKNAFDKTVND